MNDLQEQIKYWKGLGCIQFVKWHTSDDAKVCSICKMFNEKEFPIEGILEIFPAHRNCRCKLTPIVESDLVFSPLSYIYEMREAEDRSAGDLADEQPENPPQQYVEIRIGFPENEYWIDLDQIPKRKVLLEVLDRLSDENWITNEMMHQFLEKVCENRGWNLHNPY